MEEVPPMAEMNAAETQAPHYVAQDMLQATLQETQMDAAQASPPG